MGVITIVGLDLAKNVFQVHGVDDEGNIVVRRRLRRADVLPFFEQLPRSLVGLEACASAHYWARAIAALGHTVKLMPPAYVKPYVKRGKTDAADAEAICEAVTRPTMRFVAPKTAEQQATLMLHKTRDLLVRQRTMLTNALRAHLAEYGIISAQGVGGVGSAIKALHEDQATLPRLARFALHGLVAQLRSIEVGIEKIEAEILKWHRSNEASRRLATIPGIGPITASAIAASVPDASLFRSGRQFAAWLGLTPKSHSSGGTERQVGISKQGDGYLRRLLVIGATAVLRFARQNNPGKTWATRLLERKRPKVVAVALANKTARIAWALMARGSTYAAA
jgi:transposase